MGRLRQSFPQNYGSSTNINSEFESVIRYLNAAELGNKTLAELLAQLFDADGTFVGPIEFRRDSDDGIEYRIGEYTDPEQGWVGLIDLDELRGEPGVNLGEIGAPLVYGREDYLPTNGTTIVDYAYLGTDALMVFKNGLLQRDPEDYTRNLTGGTGGGSAVVFGTALDGTDAITIFKVRSELITGYNRVDHITIAPQTVFAFPHDETTRLLVFQNGILLREGQSHDYTTSAATDTITTTSAIPAGNIITIMAIENALTTAVTGLMLEEQFTDLATGLIKWAKIKVADAEIPQAKVNGLPALASSAAKITVSASTPVSPASGNLWLDTSASPNELKFYDGSQWLRTTPASALPALSADNANRFVRLNGTGTAFEYANVDLSSVVPLSQKGAASGVATLDGSAKIPASQLPTSISRLSLHKNLAGAVADGTKQVTRLWNQRVLIDSVALRVSAGTLTARLSVNGVGFGSTFAVSTTPTEIKLGQGGNPDTPQDVDATGSSKNIEIIVTSASGASDLDIVVGCSVTAT